MLVKIHLRLLPFDPPKTKETCALSLGDGTYEVLVPKKGDLAIEHWEFSPGSVVRCRYADISGKSVFLASEYVGRRVEMASPPVIYVSLLEEGTATMRPTEAIIVGEGLYKLLPTKDYDPEDEIWEFLPGTVVRCKEVKSAYKGFVLLAYEAVEEVPLLPNEQG